LLGPDRPLVPASGYSPTAYMRRPPVLPPLHGIPSSNWEGRLDNVPQVPAFGWARPASSIAQDGAGGSINSCDDATTVTRKAAFNCHLNAASGAYRTSTNWLGGASRTIFDIRNGHETYNPQAPKPSGLRLPKATGVLGQTSGLNLSFGRCNGVWISRVVVSGTTMVGMQ
jgi:hypothetical protein